MSDLISRQVAIEHLKKRLYETALNNNTEYPYYEEMADNRVSVWLEEVPSAPQWIPCSRLPEKDGYYLVTEDDGDIEIEWYDNSFAEWGYYGVIAWMPLPEPYKGATE